MTVCETIEQALAGIEDGASILAGGFGLVGIPQRLIEGLRDRGARNLTLVCLLYTSPSPRDS